MGIAFDIQLHKFKISEAQLKQNIVYSRAGRDKKRLASCTNNMEVGLEKK